MGEVGKRIISGLIIAAVFIFSFNYSGLAGIFLYLFMVVAALLTLREFYLLVGHKQQGKAFMLFGLIIGFIILTFFYLHNLHYETLLQIRGSNVSLFNFFYMLRLKDSIFFILTSSLFFAVIIFFVIQIKNQKIENTIFSMAITIFGIVYVIIPMSHIFFLKNLKNGTFYIWFVVWITIASDSGAYICGKLFGKHKIGFKLSPNKTYEGYIGGWFVQLSFTAAFYYIVKNYFTIPSFNFAIIIAFSLVIYIVSIIGDLSESLLKRDAGQKDSGTIIPGHGGMLDTLDALIFTLPAFFYTYKVINLFVSLEHL